MEHREVPSRFSQLLWWSVIAYILFGQSEVGKYILLEQLSAGKPNTEMTIHKTNIQRLTVAGGLESVTPGTFVSEGSESPIVKLGITNPSVSVAQI